MKSKTSEVQPGGRTFLSGNGSDRQECLSSVRLSIFLILLVFLCPAIAKAAIGPIGPEIQVNQTTAGDQERPEAAMDDAGNFVVVWSSDNLSPSCTIGNYYVMARVYNADGTPRTDEFQVNTTPVMGGAPGPGVAMDANGDFMVVWPTGVPDCVVCPPPCPDDHPDGDETAILGQRFNLDGVPQGSEFIANSNGTGEQLGPRVGMDGLGNFVVGWGTGIIAPSDVYMRRFQADGTPLTGDTLVNQTAGVANSSPLILMNRSAKYVVGWSHSTNAYFRVYDENGNPVTGELQANTYPSDSQALTDVSIYPDGSFIAAWQSDNPSDHNSSQDGSWNGVFAQRFDQNGNKVGPEFQVNTTTFYEQGGGAISLFTSQFIIAFGDLSNLVDNELKYQGYLSNGSTIGFETIATITTADHQGQACWAYNWTNSAYLILNSFGQDLDGEGIFMRRFGPVQGPIPTVSDVVLVIMFLTILIILTIQIKRKRTGEVG